MFYGMKIVGIVTIRQIRRDKLQKVEEALQITSDHE